MRKIIMLTAVAAASLALGACNKAEEAPAADPASTETAMAAEPMASEAPMASESAMATDTAAPAGAEASSSGGKTTP